MASGVLGLAAQTRDDLPLHPGNRLLVEAGLGNGKPQHLEGIVDIRRQRAHRAVEIVAARIEADAHRQVLQTGLERLRIEITRALVEGRGEQVGEPFLPLRILRGPAFKGELDGNDRHRVVLDQPGGEAAGRGDLLDLHGCERARGGGDSGDDEREGQKPAAEGGKQGHRRGSVRRGGGGGEAAAHCCTSCVAAGSCCAASAGAAAACSGPRR